jgi:hypothetical protein
MTKKLDCSAKKNSASHALLPLLDEICLDNGLASFLRARKKISFRSLLGKIGAPHTPHTTS